jgi:hypothetical protein
MLPKFRDLARSSDAGCTFCSAIMNALLSYMPFNLIEEDRIRMISRFDLEHASTLEVHVITDPLPRYTRSAIEFFTTSGKLKTFQAQSCVPC